MQGDAGVLLPQLLEPDGVRLLDFPQVATPTPELLQWLARARSLRHISLLKCPEVSDPDRLHESRSRH
jgi:hypothetical protein